MGHAWQLYISNLVMKLRGNGRFQGLDKKILAASDEPRAMRLLPLPSLLRSFPDATAGTGLRREWCGSR